MNRISISPSENTFKIRDIIAREVPLTIHHRRHIRTVTVPRYLLNDPQRPCRHLLTLPRDEEIEVDHSPLIIVRSAVVSRAHIRPHLPIRCQAIRNDRANEGEEGGRGEEGVQLCVVDVVGGLVDGEVGVCDVKVVFAADEARGGGERRGLPVDGEDLVDAVHEHERPPRRVRHHQVREKIRSFRGYRADEG